MVPLKGGHFIDQGKCHNFYEAIGDSKEIVPANERYLLNAHLVNNDKEIIGNMQQVKNEQELINRGLAIEIGENEQIGEIWLNHKDFWV